jgi:hypothetical protein
MANCISHDAFEESLNKLLEMSKPDKLGQKQPSQDMEGGVVPRHACHCFFPKECSEWIAQDSW